MTTDTTYRVIALEDREQCGPTAATPELARLGALNLAVRNLRLGLERTDWHEQSGKMRPYRTILEDAETQLGEWDLGPGD
jgi:hypothetical protein